MATSYPFRPIVSDGVILYYDTMNIKSYLGSGTIIYDLTRNQNNGVLTNTPSIDKSGVIFDGVNDYIDTNFIPTLGTGSITYDVWFKTSTIQRGSIINVRTGGDSQVNLSLSNSNGTNIGSNLLMFCYDETTLRISATTQSWVDGIWHNAVLTHNSTNDKLYVDGIIRLSSTSAAMNINNTAPIRVGGLGAGPSILPGWYFNGSISNVKVYNRVLTPDEVLQNYNALKNKFI